jgi:hypothetical protein
MNDFSPDYEFASKAPHKAQKHGKFQGKSRCVSLLLGGIC